MIQTSNHGLGNTATMHKGMTFFVRDANGIGRVIGTDTIAEAGRTMAQYFQDGQHAVSFTVLDTDAPGVPSVDVQVANRLSKLRRIALAAGRAVNPSVRRNGSIFTALVCK